MHVFFQLKFSWYSFGNHGIICSVWWHDRGKVIHCKPESCTREGGQNDGGGPFEQKILQARSTPNWVTRRGGSVSKLRTWWNHCSLHHHLQSRWFRSACKLVFSNANIKNPFILSTWRWFGFISSWPPFVFSCYRAAREWQCSCRRWKILHGNIMRLQKLTHGHDYHSSCT